MAQSRKFRILCLLICMSLVIKSSVGLRIIGLFPLQVHSHFVMCQELMRGLAEKGHHVDVYSHFPLDKPTRNYHDFVLKDSNIKPVSNNVPYAAVNILSSGIDSMISRWFSVHQGPLCDLMSHPLFQKLLHDPPKDPPYDLVITELSIIHCYIPFGRHLNVPVIGVVTPPLMDWQYDGFGNPINLAVDRSMASATAAPMTFLQRLSNLINYKRTIRSFSKNAQQQDQYVEKYFGPGHPSVLDLLKDVSLVLVNHDISLNGVMPFAPKVIPVGGLHIVDHEQKLPEVVQKWLDESTKGCIYFSIGSMARLETFPKHIIHAIYKSFENIAPVRVLLKIAKPEELPPGLPSNVLTQSWFQQIAVLKHKNVKAFVTHGGLMGTQEAVYYGVPMVGIPLFGDQPLNIATYVSKNIAIKVELFEITEESLTRAFKEILENPLYRETMQRVSRKFRDRPLTPLESAIFWIEYIHRHGKDALKSPVEDMPWWQASLVDVYAFIGGSVLLVLYICVKLLKKMIFFCSIKAGTTPNRHKKNH